MFPSSHGVLSQKRRRGSGPPPAAESIFQSANITTSSPNTTSDQVGYQFTPNVDLTLTALRVFLGANSNGEVLRVWRVSDQALLGSVTVDALANSWVGGDLSSPIDLDSGVAYAITTHSGNSRTWYSVARTNQTWSSLITPGAGRLGAGSGFPGTTNPNNVWGIMDGLIAPR